MVRIVDTRSEHIDDILRIEQQCFSLPWTREQLTAQMTDSMHVFLAAEAETAGQLAMSGLCTFLTRDIYQTSPCHRTGGARE